VVGLPDSARDELLAKLPLKAGDVPTADLLNRTSAAVKAFDEHLGLQLAGTGSQGMQIRIVTPGTPQPAIQQVAATTATAEDPQRPRVSAKVVNRVAPQYPPLAKQARIAGAVTLEAVISKEGRVQNVTAINGHPLLVQAAIEAVRQWEFEPTLLNGSPAEVKTQITVNFQLPDQTAAK
jgi:TonB family protein